MLTFLLRSSNTNNLKRTAHIPVNLERFPLLLHTQNTLKLFLHPLYIGQQFNDHSFTSPGHRQSLPGRRTDIFGHHAPSTRVVLCSRAKHSVFFPCILTSSPLICFLPLLPVLVALPQNDNAAHRASRRASFRHPSDTSGAGSALINSSDEDRALIVHWVKHVYIHQRPRQA